MLLRAGWALQVFTGPLCYTLHAPAMLWDFHSDNNHPSPLPWGPDAILCIIPANHMSYLAEYEKHLWQSLTTVEVILVFFYLSSF